MSDVDTVDECPNCGEQGFVFADMTEHRKVARDDDVPEIPETYDYACAIGSIVDSPYASMMVVHL